MEKIDHPPGLHFFGNLVDLDCHLQDLKLLLRKTEEIEFPYHEGTDGDDILITVDFPDITRKSFIVTLLIALDDQFRTYCDLLKTATGQKLKWGDLKGSPLDRFVAYSEKVCGLGPVCDEPTRQLLQGLIEVRNCIVHNNSCLEGFSKPETLESFAKKVEGVEIEDGRISLDLDGCHRCTEIVSKFMEQAYYSALERFPNP